MLQFFPIIFWQATGLFALAVLHVTVPPAAFSRLPLVAASSRASLQPAMPGCRYNPCLNRTGAKKNSFACNIFLSHEVKRSES
jgi:hypothetical protein